MSCKQNDRLYSLIHILRDCSFCTFPADIPTILSQMKERRALLPGNTPSDTSTRRLLTDEPRQLRRTIYDAEEFLSEEYNGFKELLLFQIIRRWKDENDLTNDDLDCSGNTEQSTRKGLFHLTYRMTPDLVTADRNGDVPFVSGDEYQFRISARWQMILDLLSSLPCISADDAAGLTSVLSRSCTLGEIPLRVPQDRDRECIDFSVLARLTRHFQSAHKAANLPTPQEVNIPCMDIVVGRYDIDSAGSLQLVPGETVTGYPVSTHFRDGVYHLTVICESDDAFFCRHLRADRILDCMQNDNFPAIPLAELDISPEDSRVASCHYAVEDCTEETLVSIIDRFGKSSISNCSRRGDSGESFWNFTISIPKTAQSSLHALHSNIRRL